MHQYRCNSEAPSSFNLRLRMASSVRDTGAEQLSLSGPGKYWVREWLPCACEALYAWLQASRGPSDDGDISHATSCDVHTCSKRHAAMASAAQETAIELAEATSWSPDCCRHHLQERLPPRTRGTSTTRRKRPGLKAAMRAIPSAIPRHRRCPPLANLEAYARATHVSSSHKETPMLCTQSVPPRGLQRRTTTLALHLLIAPTRP